jgi:hypothetical protein
VVYGARLESEAGQQHQAIPKHIAGRGQNRVERIAQIVAQHAHESLLEIIVTAPLIDVRVGSEPPDDPPLGIINFSRDVSESIARTDPQL